MSIDDYDTGTFIAKGGFGEVYKAKLRSSSYDCDDDHYQKKKNDVAIKFIAKNQLLNDIMIKRVKNEISLHSSLAHHPNIVRYLTSFEDTTYYYLVLELIEGQNLYKYLQTVKSLSEATAISILSQLVDAVAFLHEKYRIIHRDLKLSNILIIEDDNNRAYHHHQHHTHNEQKNIIIKLLDFGLATQQQHPDDEHPTFCGTEAYMAPEMKKHFAYSFPIDIWALGKIFCYLLQGLPSSQSSSYDDDNNNNNNINNNSQGAPNIPSNITKEAKDFFLQVFQEDPMKRPTIGQVKNHKIFRSLKQQQQHHREGHQHHSLLSEATPRTDLTTSSYSQRSPSSAASVSSLLSFSSSHNSYVAVKHQQQYSQKLYSPLQQLHQRQQNHYHPQQNHQIQQQQHQQMLQLDSMKKEIMNVSFKINKLSQLLPSFLLSPSLSSSSSSSSSAALVRSSLESLTSTPSSSSSSPSSFSCLFHTKDGNIYYFSKKMKIFLQFSASSSSSSLLSSSYSSMNSLSPKLYYGKMKEETYRELKRFIKQSSSSSSASSSSSSSSSSPSSSHLVLFNETNYPSSAALTSSLFDLRNYHSSNSNEGGDDDLLDVTSSFSSKTSKAGHSSSSMVKMIFTNLQHIHQIMNGITNKIPKLILYYQISPQSQPSQQQQQQQHLRYSHASPSSSLKIEKLPNQSVKCLFMFNEPFPDFHIQWLDGTRLTYFIQSSQVIIHKPKDQRDAYQLSVPLRWEGSLSSINAHRHSDLHQQQQQKDQLPSSSSSSFPPVILDQYLAEAQFIIRRCLQEESKLSKAIMKELKENKLKGPKIVFL